MREKSDQHHATLPIIFMNKQAKEPKNMTKKKGQEAAERDT